MWYNPSVLKPEYASTSLTVRAQISSICICVEEGQVQEFGGGKYEKDLGIVTFIACVEIVRSETLRKKQRTQATSHSSRVRRIVRSETLKKKQRTQETSHSSCVRRIIS